MMDRIYAHRDPKYAPRLSKISNHAYGRIAAKSLRRRQFHTLGKKAGSKVFIFRTGRLVVVEVVNIKKNTRENIFVINPK